ncbi:MAG: alpha/beta hydrolase [Chloroflexota bacterium]
MTSSYLYLNGLRIHYLHWEQTGGRPLVLLHGLASNAHIWDLLAPRLLEHSLQPLAPDTRGHGLSDKPDDSYGFDAVVGDLAAFIDSCHLEHPLLVGHSWGGHIILDYAARFPTGPRAPAGLVLVDGGITQLDDAPGATWEEVRQRLTPPRLAGMPLETFLDNLSQWTQNWGPLSDEIIAIILANFAIDENDVLAPHLTFERHMQIVRALWEFQTYERFPKVRCPALAVLAAGAQPRSPGDQAFLEARQRGLARAQAHMPNLQAHWMADTIHDVPLQRPAELAEMIARFAASLE